MEEYKSILSFNSYIVNEVNFKYNDNFVQQSKKGTTVKFSIKPNIYKNENKLTIELITKIFENAEQNNYPFEMMVKLTGNFSTEGDNPDKFIKNAIAILYPYIRAIVSTYTASANVTSLILPAINVNKLIDEQEKKKVTQENKKD